MKYLKNYNEASIIGLDSDNPSWGKNLDLDYIKSVFVDFYEDINCEVRAVKADNKVDITIKPWNPSYSYSKEMTFNEMSERFTKLSDMMMDIEVCVKRVLDEYKGLKYESMLSCNNDIYIKLYYSDLYEPDFLKLTNGVPPREVDDYYRESKSNSEIVLDIKDILADLKDDGYYTDVSMNPGGVSMLSVEVYKSVEKLFNWSEIEDNFDVVKGYVEENSNWSLTNVYISYFKLNSEMDKILTGREHNWTSKMFTKKFKSYDKFLSFVKSTEFTDKHKLSEVSLIFDVRN